MTEDNEEMRGIRPAQWGVIALVIAFTSGALLYRYLWHIGLSHTAAMFLGIPAILAILLALTPGTKSLTGGILKGITLALLIVAPLLGEGYLCILIASPLFYIVGLLVGVFVDAMHRDKTTTISCVAIVLLPMCLEGVTPQWSFHRSHVVAATEIVDAPAADVEAALSQSLNLQTPLPRFLAIGFPRPLEVHGAGLNVGSTRTIHFSGAEGDAPGDLVMRVVEHTAGSVRFETISDASKLTQWISWDNSQVTWAPVDAAHTRVTWQIEFERQLDPAWYFTPWERFAVKQAARYLIAANATPTREPRQ